MQKPILCIGRSYGSGGREIGEKLAHRLDHRLCAVHPLLHHRALAPQGSAGGLCRLSGRALPPPVPPAVRKAQGGAKDSYKTLQKSGSPTGETALFGLPGPP